MDMIRLFFRGVMPCMFAEGEGSGGEGSGEGAGEGSGDGGTQVKEPPAFTWKQTLAPDYQGAPSMKNYPDTKDGFNNFVKSSLELEKMMGSEKVPIPKGDFKSDADGWARYSKAMGVPDQAEGYALSDAEVPDSLRGLTFDKNEFQKVMHELKIPPSQAKGMWDVYQAKFKDMYSKSLEEQQNKINLVKNSLRSEWGEAYNAKVELGQMVINKFSSDKATEDFVTQAVLSDPRGAKWLAKIGEQFAENKIGDFAFQKFSLSPEQAQEELDKILADQSHAYNSDKSTVQEHERAVDYVNNLHRIIAGGKV